MKLSESGDSNCPRYGVENDGADHYSFTCKRCGLYVHIGTGGDKEHEIKLKFIQTAIDGKERELGVNVRVIQKT